MSVVDRPEHNTAQLIQNTGILLLRSDPQFLVLLLLTGYVVGPSWLLAALKKSCGKDVYTAEQAYLVLCTVLLYSTVVGSGWLFFATFFSLTSYSSRRSFFS